MNRILFVDDEPMLLEALRNAMRSKRKEWEMVFVNGGAAALLELKRAPADVIVSDMRMPEMDGASFLGEASRVIIQGDPHRPFWAHGTKRRSLALRPPLATATRPDLATHEQVMPHGDQPLAGASRLG